jgi:hypothetical protein
MCKPLIHVGYQKTASTFLQQEVFSNTSVFDAPWGTKAAQAIEAFVLQHPCRFDPSEVQSAFIAKRGKVPVISNEDLLGYPIYGRYYASLVIDRIASTFPNARVLVCIREQRAMLLSNYFQYVRQGGTNSLSHMLIGSGDRSGFRPTFRLDHFEYDLTYSLLRAHFDDEQILILPMELLRSDLSGFMRRLNDFIGVNYSWDLTDQTVVNRRSSPTTLRVERILNGVLPNPPTLPERYSDYPLHVRVRNRLVRAVDRFTSNNNFSARFLEKIKGQIEDHVGAYFDASNRKVSELAGVNLASLGYRVGGSQDD